MIAHWIALAAVLVPTFVGVWVLAFLGFVSLCAKQHEKYAPIVATIVTIAVFSFLLGVAYLKSEEAARHPQIESTK